MWRKSTTRAATRTFGLAAALCCAAFICAPVRADAEAAIGDLVVNGWNRGPIVFDIGTDGQVLLRSDTIHAALAGDLKPSILDALSGSDRFVNVQELTACGIHLFFDRSAIVLSMNIEPASMAPSTISLAPSPSARKGELQVRNSGFSTTLGSSMEIDPDYTWNAGGGSTAQYSARLELNPSVRTLGIVAEGDAGLFYSQNGFSWQLNRADAVKDFPRLGARLEAGMVNVNALSFQSGQQVYGLSFARDPGLPGGARKLASLSDEFILLHDADISIAINGVVAKQLRLPIGRYHFSDLPLVSGLNNVTVTISEQGAAPRSIRLGVPFDLSLLAPGQVDYALTLGSIGIDSLDPFGGAHLAIGIGNFLQLGANAEAGLGTVLGGLTTFAATPLGGFSLEGAVSSSYGSAFSLHPQGYAVKADWSFSYPENRGVPSLGASAQYLSPGFSLPSSAIPSSVGTLNLSGQIGESLPGNRGSISLFGQGSLVDQVLKSWTATLGLSVPVGRSSNFSVSGGCDWGCDFGYGLRATATFTVTPPGGGTMNYNQSYSGGNDNENISLSDRSGRLSANVNGQGLLNPGSDRAVGFSATGRTDVAIFSGSSRYFMSADGQSSELSGSLGLSTTLAFADGYIAATGSPSQALAILVPSSDLRGQRVDLHPMSGGGGATSPSGWAAIVNGLTPYTDYVAGVELPQSPPDTRPNLSSIEFMPQYRSIAVIRVGLAPSIAIRATLVDDEKAPVANMPGDLVGAKGALVPGSGTFTDEKGVFECYGLAPGMMSMRWADGSILTFTVPASRPGSIIDLGIVTAQVSSPGGQQ